ncbi:Mre11 DNA-binding presumed domain-containing protein [Lipomyces arxii]|uniref:Mre11 DNA-binding presumed domain-containing protein n=1 Tax=Lipomyces arxii TaxID=56418 RepID=UPI0034D01E11
MPVSKRSTRGPDTIRILISSDNHVGYNERDPIRGEDSFNTFEEIITAAKERDVDMVLLAGDLFHENKPSHKAVYVVEEILRKMCYDHKPCELELLSDANIVLQDSFGHINYEDEHINVAIPVLAISGNHDDATGDAHLSALDTIAVTGLINHIGKVPENDNITLAPLLFRKGFTKMALYGMANVRDERLHRTFRDKKVKFLRPAEDDEDNGPYFNLMALHQNHHAHTETGYLPETFLPHFLDLVVWGHEHECLIDPSENPETGFHVMQPGSSVVTNLCESEAAEKYIAILSVTGQDFNVEKIRLKTVRPFVMRDVVLSRDCGFTASSKNKGQIMMWLIEKVEKLIEEAKTQWRVANSDSRGNLQTTDEPPLPLIRLRVVYRVEYSGGYEMENPRRFSNRFVGRVANINDVVQFYRKKTAGASGNRASKSGQAVDIAEAVELDQLKVQSLVENYLKNKTLNVVPAAGLIDAVGQFVDKDDKQAIRAFVDDSLGRQLKRLLALGDVDDDTIENAVTNAAADLPVVTGPIKRRQYEDETKRAEARTATSTRPSAASKKLQFSDGSEDEFDRDVSIKRMATRTRKPLAKKAAVVQSSDASEIESVEGVVAKKPSKAKRQPAKREKRVQKEQTPIFLDQQESDEIEDEILEDSSDVETVRARKAASGKERKQPTAKQTKTAQSTRSRALAARKTAATSSQGTVDLSQPMWGSRPMAQARLSTNASGQTSMSRPRAAPIEIVDDDEDDFFA